MTWTALDCATRTRCVCAINSPKRRAVFVKRCDTRKNQAGLKEGQKEGQKEGRKEVRKYFAKKTRKTVITRRCDESHVNTFRCPCSTCRQDSPSWPCKLGLLYQGSSEPNSAKSRRSTESVAQGQQILHRVCREII